MKQIPILFSTPMVQAILEGRKSQTRRLLKCKRISSEDIASVHPDGAGKGWIAWAGRAVSAEETRIVYPGDQGFKCPYGAPGDVLWVRETFRKYCKVDEYGYTRYDQEVIEFAADNPPMINECDGDGCTMFKKDGTEKFISWKPSIFLPKEAARIWLQVTDVKVERLQDISEEDAIAEGIEKKPGSSSSTKFDYRHYGYNHSYDVGAKASFRTLWDSINGSDSWPANPWLWVVSFKVLSITGKPETNVI